MKLLRILGAMLVWQMALTLWGQAPAEPVPSGPPPSTAADEGMRTAAAAAVASGHAEPRTPDLLEHLVDSVLALFDVKTSGNTTTHYTVAAVILVAAYLLRRIVAALLFGLLRRLASRTSTSLDDKLAGSLDAPVGAFIMVVGVVSALKVLKLSSAADEVLRYGSTIAFSLVVFWLLLRAFDTLLDHLQEVSQERKLTVAGFMPWIKRTLLTIFFVFGVLMIAQSLGADVKAFLAGLGIGGLAFALAAQDTLANLFGAVVVAVDQPFKTGDYVQIGAHQGIVEDIGLRSTKLRTPQRTLITIPNKSVAAEAINNFSRMPQRRVDQTFGFALSTSVEQMHAILADIRAILQSEPEIDPSLTVVHWTSFSPASFDVQLAFFAKDPNFTKHLALRERVNLRILEAARARGLTFAAQPGLPPIGGELLRDYVPPHRTTPVATYSTEAAPPEQAPRAPGEA